MTLHNSPPGHYHAPQMLLLDYINFQLWDILSAADPLNAANLSDCMMSSLQSTDTEMGYFAASSIVLRETTS